MSEPDPLEVLGSLFVPLPPDEQPRRLAQWQPGRAGHLTPEMIEQALKSWVPAEPGAELGVWFDRDGCPIGPVRHQFLQDNDDYRIVAEHWLCGWRVSTVWTGFDQSPVPPSLRPGDAPMIYETMLFGPGGTCDSECDWDALPDDPSRDQAIAAVLAELPGTRTHYATADEASEGPRTHRSHAGGTAPCPSVADPDVGSVQRRAVASHRWRVAAGNPGRRYPGSGVGTMSGTGELFECAVCHGTFTKGRRDEEVMEEARSLFPAGDLDEEEPGLVCDPCFLVVMAWAAENEPGHLL